MQFLVFSDSHGHGDRMLSVIAQHPAIRDILFLGDGLADLLPLRRRFSEHRFRRVTEANRTRRGAGIFGSFRLVVLA